MVNLETNNQTETVINIPPEATPTSVAVEYPESSNQTDGARNAEIQEEMDNLKISNQNTDTNIIMEANHRTRKHVQLYQAALRGDWEEAKTIINERKGIVRENLSRASDYPLHIAVAGQDKEFVKNLLLGMKLDDLTLKNQEDNTALHTAAALGAIKIAEMLVKKETDNPTKIGLTNIEGGKKEIPIYLAALFGHRKMVKYLYDITNFDNGTDKDFQHLFLALISADIYDVAMRMLNDEKEKVRPHLSETDIEDALRLMARKPSAFSQKDQLSLFKKSSKFISMGYFYRNERKQTLAHQLVEKLWRSVKPLSNGKVPYLPQLLFDAAESGNVEFLIILIRFNPDIIWISNEKKRSIFHIAALNRHKSVFNLIYEIKGIKNFVATYVEETTKNNLLHLVARLPPPNRLQTVSGAALQMQRELLWFQAVEEIVPRSYVKDKNAKGELAHDLFTKAHRNLRKEGEKWMKDTATACMLAATLIATIVFAAAFTLPGGNVSSDDKDNTKVGFPQFRKKFWFDMFIISDSVALLFSVLAIGLFLSILTSRYAEKDFRVKLPTKLMFGLLALFVSIFSMVLAFTAAMILIRDNEPKWSLILIIFLACLAAISFAFLHGKLWFRTLRAAYLSKYFLFRGRKSGLFESTWKKEISKTE